MYDEVASPGGSCARSVKNVSVPSIFTATYVECSWVLVNQGEPTVTFRVPVYHETIVTSLIQNAPGRSSRMLQLYLHQLLPGKSSKYKGKLAIHGASGNVKKCGWYISITRHHQTFWNICNRSKGKSLPEQSLDLIFIGNHSKLGVPDFRKQPQSQEMFHLGTSMDGWQNWFKSYSCKPIMKFQRLNMLSARVFRYN